MDARDQDSGAGGRYRVRFGDFELDPGRRELTRDGKPVEVQKRVFDLLVFLVEHRDRAVNKDEIQDAVWPRMVVTETALTRAVMKARRAVGDDASQQSVIKTVHGHGYRFVANVAVESDSAPAEGSEPPGPAATESGLSLSPTAASNSDPTDEPRTGHAPDDTGRARVPPTAHSRHVRWAIAGLIVAAATFAIAALLLSPAGPPAGTRVAVLPVVNQTGDAALDWASLGLMSLASGLIQNAAGVAVVPDAEVMQITESFYATDVRNRVRRALGATHVLSMALEKSGGMFRMRYSLAPPSGSETVGTMVGDESTELTRGVVRSIVARISGRARMREAVETVSDDPFINEAFARGMNMSLAGRCREARDLFKVAMEGEPKQYSPRLQYARCAQILGFNDEAETLLRQLIDTQRQAGATRPLAQSLQALGVVYTVTGQHGAAESVLTEALQAAGDVADHDLAGTILTSLAIVAKDRNQFDAARELAGRAIVAFGKAGRESPPGHVHSLLANIGMQQGELDEAEGHLERALAAFRLVGNRQREAMMLNNTGFLRRMQGRFDEAESWHLKSLAMREELGDRVGVGRIHGMLSVLYAERGQAEKAREAATAALAVATETRDRLFEGTSLAQLARAELMLGLDEAGLGHYRDARAVFVEFEDRMRALQVDIRLARHALAGGDPGMAETMADAIHSAAVGAGLSIAEVEALELLGQVASARGDSAATIERYTLALERVRELSWGDMQNRLTVALADAYLDAGLSDAAEPLVGLVSQQPETFDALKLLARFHAMTGAPQEAFEHMQRARALAGDRWTEQDEMRLAAYGNDR